LTFTGDTHGAPLTRKTSPAMDRQSSVAFPVRWRNSARPISLLARWPSAQHSLPRAPLLCGHRPPAVPRAFVPHVLSSPAYLSPRGGEKRIEKEKGGKKIGGKKNRGEKEKEGRGRKKEGIKKKKRNGQETAPKVKKEKRKKKKKEQKQGKKEKTQGKNPQNTKQNKLHSPVPLQTN